MLSVGKSIAIMLVCLVSLVMLSGCSSQDIMLTEIIEFDDEFVEVAIDDTIYNNGSSSWMTSFSTTKEYETYSIEVTNTGNSAVKLFVRDNNANGKIQIEPITIEAGETMPKILLQTKGEAYRYIVINPTNNESFEGTIRVLVGKL